MPAEKLVRDIRRAMRKHHSAEGNIRIVMEDLGSEELIENIQKLGPESFALSVPFATPLAIRHALSPRRIPPLFGRIPGVFGVDLLTGQAGKSPKIALWRPILSEPVDLADLVRRS